MVRIGENNKGFAVGNLIRITDMLDKLLLNSDPLFKHKHRLYRDHRKKEISRKSYSFVFLKNEFIVTIKIFRNFSNELKNTKFVVSFLF